MRTVDEAQPARSHAAARTPDHLPLEPNIALRYRQGNEIRPVTLTGFRARTDKNGGWASTQPRVRASSSGELEPGHDNAVRHESRRHRRAIVVQGGRIGPGGA